MDSEAGAMDAVVERIHKMVSGLGHTELDELIALIQRERAGKLDEAPQPEGRARGESSLNRPDPQPALQPAARRPGKAEARQEGRAATGPSGSEVSLSQWPNLVRTRPQANLADPGRSWRPDGGRVPRPRLTPAPAMPSAVSRCRSRSARLRCASVAERLLASSKQRGPSSCYVRRG